MPNFNYENPTNIHGGGMQTGEERLFSLVLDALAYDGYQNMTLEEILSRGADPEAVGRYESWEALCERALTDAAERVTLAYESATEGARAYLSADGSSRDEGLKQLERLIYRHIYLCFHPKNRSYVLVAAGESQLPQHLQRILPDVLHRQFGSVLGELITAVSEVKNAQMSAMMACSICGAVNIFVQQPIYCRNLFVGDTREKPNYAVIEDYLNNYFLRAVVANTAINKSF